MVYRVPYLSESPGGVAYLVGNEKSFCRGTSRGRSVSGQVTRTHILRVGLDLASAEGLCRITFGSVAGRASLSKGGVVAHFPHLGDLKRSILDVALDLWSRTCLGVDTGVGGGLPSLIRYLNVWIPWSRTAVLHRSYPFS